MMRWIVTSGLRFSRLVMAAALAVVAVGVFQLRTARVDTYPQFTPPSVQIQTEALGLSAAEVEQLITVPLEQDLLNGVPWLDTISSESMTGLSSIDLVFQPGTSLLRARQMVQERLSQAHALPNVGSPPVMIQPLSSTGRVMMIGLSSRELSPIDMSVLARWKIRPKLMGVPGVANVAIWGQRDRQLQVLVDPDRLSARGVSLNQVIDSTGNALWVSPLTFVEASTPGTGGFVDTPNQRFGVQHVFPITTATQLSSVTIEDTTGRTLRLADVADVVEDHQPLIGDATASGGPGLMLVVQKFPESDTLAVTRAVEDALDALRPGLSGIRIDTTVFRPASFLESALRNVALRSLLALLLLVVLVGGLLLSWRAALVCLVTVPVAVVAAAYVLYLTGTTFTTPVLAGLVVALGVLVDDAVAAAAEGARTHRRSALGPAVDGSADDPADQVAGTVQRLRAPLTYATLVLLLAALPALMLTGVAGAIARPLVLAYVLAILASTAVALLLAPALAVLLSRRSSGEHRPGPLRRAQPGVLRAVDWLATRTSRTLAAAGVLAVAALAVIPQLGSHRTLPALQDRDLLVQVRSAPGTSLSEMDRITAAVAGELRGVAGVDEVNLHVGRALTSDQVVNVNSGEIWVRVAPAADLSRTTEAVRRVVAGYPGLGSTVSTYLDDRLRTAGAVPPHPLVVRVYGDDLGRLRSQAEDVRRALSTVQGVRNAQVQAVTEEPTLRIEVRLAAAERYGIRPGDVRRAAATLLSGLPVGSLYEQQKVFDVVVWGTPATRHSLARVQDLLIDTPGGGHVRLRDVADVRLAAFPTVVRHDDVRRSLDVSAEVAGRGLDPVVRDVRGRLAGMSFPLEYHAEVVTGQDGQHASWWRVLAVALGAAVGMFLLFQAAAGSWGSALLVFGTLPLAAAGGVPAAWLAGGVRSLGALLGLLAVLAIAVRGNLQLVLAYRRPDGTGAPDGGAAPDGAAGPHRELVLRATRDRVAPTLLTALATAAAVLPFAVAGHVAGLEVLHPLAVVVLGALVSSTLLTLFVLPALCLRFAAAGPTTAGG